MFNIKKKLLSFFFLKINIFNFRIYVIHVFTINSRYFAHKNFRKIHEFFFNFDFVFLLIFASDCRIELIVFHVFNRNCDFAYRDRFSIFFIYYQTLLIRENNVNYTLIFFKCKYFIFSIYVEIVFFSIKIILIRHRE